MNMNNPLSFPSPIKDFGNKLQRESIFAFVFILLTFVQTSAFASPWAKNEGYWARTSGKFSHGLKHSLFSWMQWWTESREPGYQKHWQGFSSGVGKSVVHTAGGLVQLVTFPIPADFPDFGIGLHIPSKQCPARHENNYVPPVKDPAGKKEAEQKAAIAAKPALKPLTTPSTAQPEEVTPVETAEEESEAEKAQEAELAALAAAAAVKPEAAEIPDDKAPVTNEDIVSANPTPAPFEPEEEPLEEEDEESLWEDEELNESSLEADHEGEFEFSEPESPKYQTGSDPLE